MKCFTILGLESGADERQIRRAYAVLLKQHHPEDEPEKFREIRTAYEAALAAARKAHAHHPPQPSGDRLEQGPSASDSIPPQEIEQSAGNDRDEVEYALDAPLPNVAVRFDQIEIDFAPASAHHPESTAVPREPVTFLDESDVPPVAVTRSAEARPVPPERLAAEFLADLASCLADPKGYAAGQLFRHGALKSLEAKELLFHSVFTELIGYAKSTTDPGYEFLFRLEELFHWTADEISISRKLPKGDAALVFELFREKQRRKNYDEARGGATSALRWYLLMHGASVAAFAAVLLIWSLTMPH